MTIHTFSGTHAFDPTVFIDTNADKHHADLITKDIEAGRCPRCWGPLPTMPEFPAGSRITACRSIPICGPCGSDEVFEQLDGTGLSPASEWPILTDEIDERRARYHQQMKPAILTGDDGHLITEDGVGPVTNPRNTGGWTQYGGIDGGDTE